MADQLGQLLRTAVDFLEANGYRYAIIGGVALTYWGSAWICSAEDLIIQKVVAGRAKDWPDVESLLATRGGFLDTSHIEDWLGQFAEALQKPELLFEYHRILSTTIGS